jgi:hypothetical protein
MENKGLL